MERFFEGLSILRLLLELFLGLPSLWSTSRPSPFLALPAATILRLAVFLAARLFFCSGLELYLACAFCLAFVAIYNHEPFHSFKFVLCVLVQLC